MKVTKHWIMRNGKHIRICDMEDSHILRTIAMIQLKVWNNYHNSLRSGYSVLGMLQGEMAIDDVESGIATLEENGPEEYLPEIYFYLVEDAQRRKLEVPVAQWDVSQEIRQCQI